MVGQRLEPLMDNPNANTSNAVPAELKERLDLMNQAGLMELHLNWEKLKLKEKAIRVVETGSIKVMGTHQLEEV